MLTHNAQLRKEVVIKLARTLAESGFALKQNNLIRETESGLYQIISLSLGPSTSMYANHIGLGFGVAAEEWIGILYTWKRPKVLSTVQCEIRDCYCSFYNSGNSSWFRVSIGLEELTKLILGKIQNQILPFFDKVKTRQAIIDLWKTDNQAVGLPPRHDLSIGILLITTGKADEGAAILNRLLAEKKDNPFFQKAIATALQTQEIKT